MTAASSVPLDADARVDVAPSVVVASRAKLSAGAASGLSPDCLAYCASLRVVAFLTGDGVDVASVCPSTDEVLASSRVSVKFAAAGNGIRDADVVAVQWSACGHVARGAATLVASDRRVAACAVVRLTDDGRLLVEGVAAMEEARVVGGGGGDDDGGGASSSSSSLRQIRTSPSRAVVAILSRSSVAIHGLPGGVLLAREDLPASAGSLTACAWLDPDAWGAPRGAALALAFRSEIRIVGWTAAAVAPDGEDGTSTDAAAGLWGRPTLSRRVLPGAEGALRSLTTDARGRWLFASSDQKIVVPTGGAAVNQAYVDAKGGTATERVAAAAAAKRALLSAEERGGDAGSGGGGGDDAMPFIRAGGGGGGGIPRSLILSEVHVAAKAASMFAAASEAKTRHAAVHAVRLRGDDVDVCAAHLPETIGRPDVLLADDGGGFPTDKKDGATKDSTQRVVVVVGSTVAAATFAVLELLDDGGGGDAKAMKSLMKITGTASLTDRLKGGGGAKGGAEKTIRIKSVAGWPHGATRPSCPGGWILSSSADAVGRGSFTSAGNAPCELSIAHFSVRRAPPPPPSPTPPTELPKTPARSHAVEVAPTPIVGDVAARLAAVGVTPGSDLASGTSDDGDGDGGDDDDGSGEASSPPGAVARELARIRAPGSTPPRPFPDFDRRDMGVDAFIEPPDVIAGDGERGRLESTAAAPKARREAPAPAAEPAAAPDASSILSAVRALGTMLDGRMDKIEAAMQAHERRLRKIEASVASPSGGK